MEALRNKIASYYPEDGPLRRELYPKHMAFFAAGASHEERCACAANRVGKTEGLSCYELALHATGDYPDWWVGRRFERPISAWAAGKTGETTRDILQAKLLGKTRREPGAKESGNAREIFGLGTGMIPADSIIATSPKSGVADGIDTVWVRHKSGGVSTIGFKSYGRDRDSFEGTEKDWISLDEEPPKDVADECAMRLMSTRPGEKGGLMVITFTPLEGYSEVVKSYMESDDPGKWYIQIGWDDAPHISKEEIERMSRKYLPSQLKARSKGEPSMGEGAIYPIDIDELLTDDREIPVHWKQAFGMDVGKTAVVWGALDPETDILYLYREYFSLQYNTAMHAQAIKGMRNQFEWIPGVIDPGSLGSSQVDGKKLFTEYRQLGLNIALADNPVETGLQALWMRMQTGRLKVFRSLTRWQMEFSRYHRKTRETEFGIKSEVVKKDDHLMDATRYLEMSGIARAITKPMTADTWNVEVKQNGGSWAA